MRIFAAFVGFLGLAGTCQGFTNPIRKPGGSDPQITFTGGYYYLIATEWDHLALTRARTIEGLKTAQPKVIYRDSNPSRCCNVWAPELHYLSGRWGTSRSSWSFFANSQS